ncbi:class I SAM-dependent methyltransferase [Kaistella flava (ex Peng et al. 2021)]|uniref:Class I SAM-dependent methyltransferase n=1 Tax=Kaistella flava (ex Peng et al. 2021) TaxID=2038776 RepID=A0A7M2Y9D7_9FLAO|nr:class I SAM-dependent methyltransferase [Kaistella flava (ex Peng et al. 2021)]QOW10878.1 class I SAM-dependent methyltransferase [Kaistella flava (ex Peng et al. 2021)]
MKIHLLKKDHVVINKTELTKISLAEQYLTNDYHIKAEIATKAEINKNPLRSDIINFILQNFKRETCYLEIGVRHTNENFDLIRSKIKYSVDPGYESETNDVDFKMTSDEFFAGLREGTFLNEQLKFDVIFIDGSHLADQVQKDINNSLEYLADDGYIVMHDCNPPTEFHASENYYYRISPSGGYWNGTTWKAFYNARKRTDIFSCCIDTDWGIGVISRKVDLGKPTNVKNDFFEYYILNRNREESLNLITFEKFKSYF